MICYEGIVAKDNETVAVLVITCLLLAQGLTFLLGKRCHNGEHDLALL